MSQVFACLRYTTINLLVVNQIIILSDCHLYVEIWPGKERTLKNMIPLSFPTSYTIFICTGVSVFSGKRPSCLLIAQRAKTGKVQTKVFMRCPSDMSQFSSQMPHTLSFHLTLSVPRLGITSVNRWRFVHEHTDWLCNMKTFCYLSLSFLPHSTTVKQLVSLQICSNFLKFH